MNISTCHKVVQNALRDLILSSSLRARFPVGSVADSIFINFRLEPVTDPLILLGVYINQEVTKYRLRLTLQKLDLS